MPARLTAELTAFTADCNELRSWVRSPVAPGMRLCSAKTNRVKVIQLVSIAKLEDIFYKLCVPESKQQVILRNFKNMTDNKFWNYPSKSELN